MRNENGFTLVELLAVVALMAVLLTIAAPAVLSFTTRMKADMFCNKVDTVVKSAQMFGQDNMASIIGGRDGLGTPCAYYTTGAATSTPVAQCYITDVKVLLTKGYLTKEAAKKDQTPDDFFDPRDGKSMKGNNIFVYVVNKRAYAAYVFSNLNDAELCDGKYYMNGTNVYTR